MTHATRHIPCHSLPSLPNLPSLKMFTSNASSRMFAVNIVPYPLSRTLYVTQSESIFLSKKPRINTQSPRLDRLRLPVHNRALAYNSQETKTFESVLRPSRRFVVLMHNQLPPCACALQLHALDQFKLDLLCRCVGAVSGAC